MKRIVMILLALLLVSAIIIGCDVEAADDGGAGTMDGTGIEDGGDTGIDETGPDKDKDNADNESGLEGELDSGANDE